MKRYTASSEATGVQICCAALASTCIECFRWIILLAGAFALNLGVLAQAPNNATFQNLDREAQKSLEKGDYDAAIRAYTQLVRIESHSAPLYFQLGLAQYRKGNNQSAAESLQRALALQPEFPIADAFLGLCESELGHSRASLPRLEEAFSTGDQAIDPDVHRIVGIRLGRLYYDAGRHTDAELVYVKLLQQYPNDPDVLYEGFWLRMSLAQELMKTMLQKNPDSYRTHQLLGYLMAQRRNYNAALGQLRQALRKNPTAVGLHYDIGNMVLRVASDSKAATGEFEEELRLHPSHVGSYYALAELALRNQDYDRASQFYREALKYDPNQADAMVGLAKIAMARSQVADALSNGEKAVKLNQSNPRAHYILSQVYRALGRAKDADAQLAIFEKLQKEAADQSQYVANVEAGGSAEP